MLENKKINENATGEVSFGSSPRRFSFADSKVKTTLTGFHHDSWEFADKSV